MKRRFNLIAFCAVAGTFLCLIFFYNRFSSSTVNDYYKFLSTGDLGKINIKMYGKNQYYKHGNMGLLNRLSDSLPPTYNSSVTISDILKWQRQEIADEMENFEYPRELEKLSAMTPETNGTPRQSVIITTWRSGSTFLGDILNAIPANFYHYEPLLDYEIIQIRGPPNDKPALVTLKKLLTCNYTHLNDYLEYGQTHPNLFSHNTRLWTKCQQYPQYCWDPEFLSQFCKLFPIQSMKVVRLRLALAEQLMTDSLLNVRIVLLIRDPRGTLQSRKHRDWCPGQVDCDQATTLCADMVADYRTAKWMSEKYGRKFMAVRYEDLSLNPYDMTQDILEFYGLPFDAHVEEFLDSHTRMDHGGVSSTFRNSKSAPFHWIKDLSYGEVNDIQQSCTEAMQLWGYRIATDEFELMEKNFNPLLQFKLS